jgi:hypothetical protein
VPDGRPVRPEVAVAKRRELEVVRLGNLHQHGTENASREARRLASRP